MPIVTGKDGKKYDFYKAETKWNKQWNEKYTFSPQNISAPKKKFYNLMMFPYPSAEGLHAGNMFAFTGSDIFGRLKRMQGYDVFEPIGLDGFGIHSENYAIKTATNPKENARRTQENYYRQLSEIGNGFDWKRTLNTYDPDYYAWTQWVFVAMFKAGLAFRKKSEVNFCPSCKTVLADEQVVSPKLAGKWPKQYKSLQDVPDDLIVCERCGSEVEKRELAQWFFRITHDADRLLTNLKKIDWTPRVKKAQRDWIGKKTGINLHYKVEDTDHEVVCWTSRPDTNFGATFVVVAPEHPILNEIVKPKHKKEVDKYQKLIAKKSKEERMQEGRKKTGVFTGSYAINPLNKAKMPIWVSDFVLPDVGTGAVVGVPAHDKRDFEFAVAFDLPIVRVIEGPKGEKGVIKEVDQVYTEYGVVMNSGFLDGLSGPKAKKAIMKHIVADGWGKQKNNYHLRDWIISRQRYWGPPIPMIYCEHCAKENKSWFSTDEGKKVVEKLGHLNDFEAKDKSDSMDQYNGWYPEENLPVTLPDIDDYLPKGNGKGPLADHPEFYKVKCPECGREAKRETDVSDTFLDSAWYFLGYPNVGTPEWKKGPKAGSKGGFFNKKISDAWLPIDQYFGGAEHSVLHLMYSRFVTHVLHDLGYLSFEEPFPHFYAHGLVIKDGAKMSKSKGNVVNPDLYIDKYGTDTFRLYLMFMGPMDSYPDFRDAGIEGMHRFVNRVWNLFNSPERTEKLTQEEESVLDTKVHQTIKKCTEDIEHFRYNTAISAIMELVNTMRKYSGKYKNVSDKKWSSWMTILAKLIAPFAPFLAEELWHEVLGSKGSIHLSDWPKYDSKFTEKSSYVIAVQVNGKVRGTITVSGSISAEKEKVVEVAKKVPNITRWLDAKNIREIVFVPGKIVNFVTNR